MRFFTAGQNISHKLVARLTQIDYSREMAFVAIDEASGALVGVARMVADPDRRRAEYAVLVASDLKGRGLGWQLMQILIDYARREKFTQLFGDVFAANAAMINMCRDLGFKVENLQDDPTIQRVTLELTI